MNLIDTHTHLDFPDFDADRAQVIARSQAAGVQRMVVLGVQQAYWQRLWTQVEAEPALYGALGLHPCFLAQHQQQHLSELKHWLQRLAGHPQLCAIGEIGLDYYHAHADRTAQQLFFDAQLQLAQEFQLPVLLHVRRAHAAVIASLKRLPPARGGIVHAFSGSWEEAREYIKLGFKLGLGGAGTWPQARRMHQVLQQLPLEAIVLETDAPDMAPASHPGLRNSPEHLPAICTALAQLRGISPHALADISSQNARKLFGWT